MRDPCRFGALAVRSSRAAASALDSAEALKRLTRLESMSRSRIGIGMVSPDGSGSAFMPATEPDNLAASGFDTRTVASCRASIVCSSICNCCARRLAARCAMLSRMPRVTPIVTAANSAMLKRVIIIVAKVKTMATITKPPASVRLITSAWYIHPPISPPPRPPR